MDAGVASRTGQRVAMRRAAHQVLDQPVVFDDPLALRVIGQEAAREVLARREVDETLAGRNLRAFMAVRSRLAEDMLAEAVGRGVRQYVVLGAGLDTFGYRNPFASAGLKVFEVDHPDTQAWKCARLAEVGIVIPESVGFVAVDFERQDSESRLRETGFRDAEPAFFSWLGVVPYLTREAFEQTARFVAKVRGEVVFDYAVDPSLLSYLERAGLEALSRRVAKVGEPFRLFFEPRELGEFLGRVGFPRFRDWDSAELNSRYFTGRQDGLRLMGGVARIMNAFGTRAMP